MSNDECGMMNEGIRDEIGEMRDKCRGIRVDGSGVRQSRGIQVEV